MNLAPYFWILLLAAAPVSPASTSPPDRLRVIVETDAGGDPDDEQSMVRFLLYSNEWDIEGIICNMAKARDRENLNLKRTGLGIVQALVEAYGRCRPNLVKHDARYPTLEYLHQRTVPGYDDTNRGVDLIIAAVDKPDRRPVWYCDWGTAGEEAGENNLKRALDRVLRERGPEGYARFKARIRLSSADAFGDHTRKLSPPFTLWVDTFRPELEGRRWYHRFSGITATAGGFDVKRDVLTGHGPLGALYPTNTTHRQKEGDSGTFLYLVPTGMNDPEQPTWGSWAGRYGRNPEEVDRPYYWANQADTWHGSTHRDNSLARWAAHLQNDFRARLVWCVSDREHANHPPVPRVDGQVRREARAGDKVWLDARGSTDPDADALKFEWVYYPEPGSHRGPAPTLFGETSPRAYFRAPEVASAQTLHVVLVVTDTGSPPLTRYRRVIVTVHPESPP